MPGPTARRVVLLCGPPGSGKTTAARASGLLVFDRDDPHWSSDREFNAALRQLGKDPHAQAVVIRTGATSSARAKTSRTIDATEAYVVLVDQDECQRRAYHRGRVDRGATKAAIPKWFATFDRNDGIADFRGWDLTGDRDDLRHSQVW